MPDESEFTIRVSPTTDLGTPADEVAGRKSLSVAHRPGVQPQSTLDWAGPGLAAESYGRGPAVRPAAERPNDDSDSGGNA